jgi:hypothetical protein
MNYLAQGRHMQRKIPGTEGRFGGPERDRGARLGKHAWETVRPQHA